MDEGESRIEDVTVPEGDKFHRVAPPLRLFVSGRGGVFWADAYSDLGRTTGFSPPPSLVVGVAVSLRSGGVAE